MFKKKKPKVEVCNQQKRKEAERIRILKENPNYKITKQKKS